jgi:MoxR-like ATPase
LEDFAELQPPIARVEFLEDPAHKIELRKILSENKNLFFNRELKLNQGAYLTKAPKELVELWNRIYFSKTGHGLPHVEEGLVAPNRTWIFQANPEFYDLRQATKDLNQDTWLALEHKGDIHTGDRAYLWTSGPEAGIVAVAEILDEVSERPIAEQSRPYVKEPGKFLGVQPRVSVRIVKPVDPTLMRKDLLNYPELKDLSILKQPGTNFPVSASESQFIDHLINSRLSFRHSPMDQVIQWIRNVRTQTSPDGHFYYKPLVLLALLSLLDKQQDQREVIAYADLFFEYGKLATELGIMITEDQFSQPYLRLHNDTEPLQVWVPLGNGKDFEDEKSDQPQYVRSNFPYIKIESAVWPAFQSSEGREQIRRAILNRWPIDPSYTIEEAIKDLFIEKQRFEEIITLFKTRKNLILQGPPGVGKSFFAKRLAYGLIGFKASERIKMIQFHQSYTYEDFIQGYRPTQRGSFVLKKGIFYDFCIRASADPAHDYVFIIDEINRGNLSKILGEVMILIEPDKRGVEWGMSLTYATDGDPKFFVPENVYLLGMMNTADRSIAMVDYALRRRFAFVELKPEFDHPEFEIYLRNSGAEDLLIQTIKVRMAELNRKIREDKDLGAGFCIGHSFFCSFSKGTLLNESWYRRVVRTEIAPLIREYWFDKTDEELDSTIERLTKPL